MKIKSGSGHTRQKVKINATWDKNENAISINKLPIDPRQISTLIKLIEDKQISHSIGTRKIFPVMLKSDKSALEIANENNWIQESNNSVLEKYIQESLAKYPEKIKEYQRK